VKLQAITTTTTTTTLEFHVASLTHIDSISRPIGALIATSRCNIISARVFRTNFEMREPCVPGLPDTSTLGKGTTVTLFVSRSD
jgi:hypothetical protein